MPHLAILLTNGYADWECAFLNGIGGAYYGLETQNVSPDGDPVVSLGGLQTLADSAVANLKPETFDALVICGGSIWETDKAPDVTQLAKSFLDADKHVAAICGGTLALAKAGLLNNRKHTSNAPNFLSENSETYCGISHYINKVTAVEDQKVITAPGHAPAHFSAAVFRAAGIDESTVSEFLNMLSAEHS
ncbi:MAG: DJ-1/PfpI family protein [Hyphomicrobiales bacterium]